MPLSWWIKLTEDEYAILNIINTAAKILGFKMLRSFTHILKIFKKLYSELEELSEKLISVIYNYMRPYYFPEEFNRIQKVHKMLGLE
jgi:hypothetical protein